MRGVEMKTLEHEHDDSCSCFDQMESGVFENQVPRPAQTSHLKHFRELKETQQAKRVKSFGQQLWETIVDQSEKIMLCTDIIPRRFDFALEGQEFSLRFMRSIPTSDQTRNTVFTRLTEDEKKSLFMVSPKSMSKQGGQKVNKPLFLRLQTLQALDVTSGSRECYRDLCKVQVGMIREYLVQQAKEEVNHKVNSLIPLYSIKQGDIVGGYQHIQDVLPHLVKVMGLKSGQMLRIKLEGDGRKVGKTKKQVMISFCILDQGKIVLQPENHHVLSITVGGESYPELVDSLSDLFHDLESLQKNGISITSTSTEQQQHQQQHHSVELLFSSDWKFMATVLGINPANSKFPCLWCHCSHDEINNMEKTWTTTRTLTEALRYLGRKENVRSLL